MRWPKTIVAVFLVIAIASLTVLPQLTLYLSFYQLIPGEYIEGTELTRDYYGDYEYLNAEFGGDNWDYFVVRPNSTFLVTDVDAIREMNAVSEAVKNKFDYVEGSLSLAELVKIANYLATGRYEFPPDDPSGDAQIEQSMKVLLSLPQYRDQIYGNLLSPDDKTAIILFIFEKGRPLEDYRAFAEELKAFGLQADDLNTYSAATDMYPINVDTIYLKLDQVTIEEGIFWVVLAFCAVVIANLYLFRAPVFTIITLANLTVTVSATVAALYLSGGYLNLLTMLLVALIFGVGDDYTTYALTVYRNARREGKPLKEAILEAQADLGSALFICAIVTLSGFASIWLTGFPAIMIFGAMAGAGVFFSYVGCLTLVPALLYLYFGWIDRRVAAGERSASYDRLMHRAETASETGAAIANFAISNKGFILASFSLLAVLLLVPVIFGAGVKTWGGSYSAILNEDSYEMTTYNLIADELGIPVEGTVFVRGDIADPEVLRAIDALDKESGRSITDPTRDHAWVRADSLADVVRDNYPRYLAQQKLVSPDDVPSLLTPGSTPQLPLDQDGDGLPDDRATLVRMYDEMWVDPATKVLMSRVVDRNYTVSLVRVGFNVETGDGLTPVENARLAIRDIEEDVEIVRANATALPGINKVDISVSGLGVVLLAVIASIDFGNTWTTIIMIGTIFGLVTVYYRRPVHSIIIMAPLLFGVLVQYFLMSTFNYELTYVAVIITSVDMGLGIDLGVHTYSNFRAAMRSGKTPEAAIRSATGDVNLAMIAALFTDMSAFLLIPWSDVSWAAQTARVLLASVGSILLIALLVLPLLLLLDAKRNPKSYAS